MTGHPEAVGFSEKSRFSSQSKIDLAPTGYSFPGLFSQRQIHCDGDAWESLIFASPSVPGVTAPA